MEALQEYLFIDEGPGNDERKIIKRVVCNNRKNGYLFSENSVINVFENLADAEKMAKKTFRKSIIKKVVFENVNVENMYSGTGANITGFDFQNSRLLIESKVDNNKYGYDYRKLTIIN